MKESKSVMETMEDVTHRLGIPLREEDIERYFANFVNYVNHRPDYEAVDEDDDIAWRYENVLNYYQLWEPRQQQQTFENEN